MKVNEWKKWKRIFLNNRNFPQRPWNICLFFISSSSHHFFLFLHSISFSICCFSPFSFSPFPSQAAVARSIPPSFTWKIYHFNINFNKHMKYNFFDFFFNFHRALVIFLTLTVNKDSIVYSHDKKKHCSKNVSLWDTQLKSNLPLIKASYITNEQSYFHRNCYIEFLFTIPIVCMYCILIKLFGFLIAHCATPQFSSLGSMQPWFPRYMADHNICTIIIPGNTLDYNINKDQLNN